MYPFCPYDHARGRKTHLYCDLTQEENFHLLLGDKLQLEGFFWICEAIKKTGGISIGCNVEKESISNNWALVLADSNHGEHPYVFTQFRSIVKHVRGDPTEKRLITWSPFDVWRADRKTHRDAPFSWSAYLQDHGISSSGAVTAMKPCNILFDIANIPYEEHTLDWPEEFYRDSWTSPSSEEVEVNTTANQGPEPDWFNDLCHQVAQVSIEKVELKDTATPDTWQLLMMTDPGSFAASELQWHQVIMGESTTQ